MCELEMEFVEGQFADIITLAPYLPFGLELSWRARSKGKDAMRWLSICNPLRPMRGR